jgi:hypothetical protein
MRATLAELERGSRRVTDCSLVDPARTGVGGVDPLGLRQINFDLMNQLFPGVNNVARHIRPFTIVTWAWRRTIALARVQKAVLPVSAHEDFVARIEVAFVWSMLQLYEAGDVDLPGKQRISQIWGDARQIQFGDDTWKEFVKARRNSTALTAAINYGPGLRAFKLLEDDAHQPGVRVPGDATGRALDAFESKLRPILKHKLFLGWDPCVFKRSTAEEWGHVWDMNELLDEEQEAMCERLMGGRASASRRGGFTLLQRAYNEAEDDEDNTLRPLMYGIDDPALRHEIKLWRRVQVRQAFRLALETIFEWIVREIGDRTLTTAELSRRLMEAAGGETDAGAGAWFAARAPKEASPVAAMDALQACFVSGAGLEAAALTALAVTVLSDPELHDGSHRRERLPITLAAADVQRLSNGSVEQLLAHIIEQWIIAQHTYWSVGRGLADARAGGKQILRLRLMLEPEGWRVTRGGGSRGMPRPTPDRLRTAIILGQESALLES